MSMPTSASVVSSGLNQYPTVYFDRVAVETLRSTLFFYEAIEKKTMPDRSGVVMQIFGFTKLGANTTPVTEGTPGTGQALTDGTRQITLSQFADYVSFSDKVVLTNLIDTVAAGAKELGYRGALSVDNVISTQVDTDSNSDSATRIEINDGSYMTAAIARKAAFQLNSLDVQPKANGLHFGIIHSLSSYDLVNDNTAGGALDLQKYSESLASKNPALIGANKVHLGNIGGVDWYQSNAVPTETNWQSSAHIAYHAYVFGQDAYFGASLGKTALGQKNFSVAVKQFDGNNSLDPAGLIRSAAVYNFFFGVAKRPNSTNGFRRIRVESSIG